MHSRLTVAGCEPGKIHIPQIDDLFEVSADGPISVAPAVPRVKAEQDTGLDWHNHFPSFVLQLSERLKDLPDDKTREKMLNKFQSVLQKF